MDDERKCVRCGILQRMKDEEICEPCMELLILGIGNPRNEDAWNRFIEESSNALLRAKQKSERKFLNKNTRMPLPKPPKGEDNE